MVELRHLQDVEERAGAAGLGVHGAYHDPVNAALHQGAGAHLAGLQGHIQGAAFEPPVTEFAAGFVDGRDFRVGERGMLVQTLIEAAGNDLPVLDDHAADGDLPDGGSAAGLMNGFFHELFVGGEHAFSLAFRILK